MTPEIDDIQGVLLRDYRLLDGAAYLLLRIERPDATRQWLSGLLPRVTNAVGEPDARAINVAFTFSGLRALGLSDETTGLPPEFMEGMVGPRRSRILGDRHQNDPRNWSWGGPNNPSFDLLLMLFAPDDAAAEAFVQEVEPELAEGGLAVVGVLHTHLLRFGTGVKEHFGFHDGIGQPSIANDTGIDHGVLAPDRESNTVAPGEFVIGYENEFGEYPQTPIVPHDKSGVLPPMHPGYDLGRNGTYLVFRQLEQHVARFWAWVREAVGAGGEEVADAIRLASKEFGRWPSGTPLVLSPDRDPGGFSAENDFDYAKTDPDGLKCPFSAHARRGNPRDSLKRAGGAEESLLETKRHRLIRRARAFGRPLDPSMDPAKIMFKPDDGESRGLQFLCFNTDIDRQFQFVQQTWMQNPVLNDQYENPDPILTERPDGTGDFVEQDTPVRIRWKGMPPVVTMRGGAYFFMPGLKALRHLATAP